MRIMDAGAADDLGRHQEVSRSDDWCGGGAGSNEYSPAIDPEHVGTRGERSAQRHYAGATRSKR